MGLVKQATRTFKRLLQRGERPAPPESNLKDPLTDDLNKQPKLDPAAMPENESAPARSESDGPNVRALVEDAVDQIVDEGGTDVHTYEAFAETVAETLGPDAVSGATDDLLMEVKAADKRVARSFADTVKGHGGAAWSYGADEEEEEGAEAEEPKAKKKKPAAKKPAAKKPAKSSAKTSKSKGKTS